MAAADLLTDLWYFALPADRLRRGQMLGKTLFGRNLLFVRPESGPVFALDDLCPHRAMPLRHGRVAGCEVECCYHGWRFDGAGRCTAIPALVEGQGFDVGRIKVRTWPVRESQGLIWVFAGTDPSVAPPPPDLPAIGDRRAGIVERVEFPAHVDHAVVGLMDPAHGPFVHRAWWWRSARSIHAKEKRFEASELGFRMLRHAPSTNAAAYKLLGGGISTEITFRLPGLRIEHIQAGRYDVVGLTAVSPIDQRRSELHHLMWWTAPWLTPIAPLFRPFARKFLEQDRRVVALQQEGLAGDPPLMLVDDADRPAKWYYRLRREWQAARGEGRAFVNPVKARTLRWRS